MDVGDVSPCYVPVNMPCNKKNCALAIQSSLPSLVQDAVSACFKNSRSLSWKSATHLEGILNHTQFAWSFI